MMKHAILLLAALSVLSPSPSAAGQQPPQAPPQGSYRIAPNDVLDIVVWRNPELTRTVTVRPDGWISYPIAGEVRVDGMTPAVLQDTLETAFATYVTSPMVTVVVSRVAGFRVSILGKVRLPGRYDVEGTATVLDVLALAGGPNDYADTSRMYVLRPKDGEESGYEQIFVRYVTTDNESVSKTNVRVKPGDIVIVP